MRLVLKWILNMIGRRGLDTRGSEQETWLVNTVMEPRY